MDREKLQSFIRAAEADLASVRSSLLIIAQTGDASDVAASRSTLTRLKAAAYTNWQPGIVALIGDCETALEGLAQAAVCSPKAAYAALDMVASIEAAVFEIPLHSDDFLSDIGGFVDSSFSEMLPPTDEPAEEFEIDEETLDIFRSEADELLSNIANSLHVLSASTGDQTALWEIRRNAHTFKGAAGIVGLKDAAEIAHRMEDLLDKMVEMRREAVPQVVDFLDASAGRLDAIVTAKSIDDDSGSLEKQYVDVMAWLSSSDEAGGQITENGVTPEPASPRVDSFKATTTPIVRVSLDRLDDLLKISSSLLINHSSLAERFAELSGGDAETLVKLESLFDVQRKLTDEMHDRLLRIRMVKFGNLETRLSRAVQVTCVDENKKAVVELENGDVEIDTQIIDALIEPLLHLLKNAVVHGIEPPDTRRLIGKPERGNIRIRIDVDDEGLILSVADDGCGISVSKLKEKAVANGLIDKQTAASMDDRSAMKLIFDRGLTTADRVDLNAGRGVGMSIVKESVENRGGTVQIESEPQRGTTFTIIMPLALVKPEPSPDDDQPAENTGASAGSLPPLVFVVDDSASIRRQTTKLVEEAGFRVITANNGAEALELLLSGDWEPDLILSDVEMPQIDGWEFLQYVRSDENLGHIPVVMVTSLNTDEHRQRAMDLGAADYLVKPISLPDLEIILEKFCGSLAV